MSIKTKDKQTPAPLSSSIPFKYHIHTFGCQMNINDSERIEGLLKTINASPSPSLEESNLIIVNTCAVRQKSEDKLYSLLGRLQSIKEKNGAIIGVAGCVAQLHHSDLIHQKPVIDFVIGPDNYQKIPEILLKLKQTEKRKIVETNQLDSWESASETNIIHKSPLSAYVTIMEGCNNFCAYCIVPFTRGREKYRPKSHILEEFKTLSQMDYKEIILLGQNVNSYIDPETNSDFADLLRQLESVSFKGWIRFITSHPKNFSNKVIKVMSENPQICHALHLPLQSGATSVLKRMKRGYSVDEYLQKIKRLRDSMPDISLSTDIIVGFPDETEKEYEETVKMLKEIRFTNIFSFKYSPRPGTHAAGFEDSVSMDIKTRRLIDLQALQREIQLELNQSFIGKTIKTLCMARSKKDKSRFTGRNEGYQVINFDSDKDVQGQMVNVTITGCGPYSLHGEIKNTSS